MAIVSRCCWFQNLDDGSIAVSLFYVGLDIIGIAFYSVVYALTEDVMEAFTAQGYNALKPDEMKKTALIWISILPLHLIFTIVMFNGLMQRRRWLLLPWLVMDIPRLCYSVVQVVMDVITETDPPMITLCFNGLLFIGMQAYFALCIISQYQVLKDEEEKKRQEAIARYFPVRMPRPEDCAL